MRIETKGFETSNPSVQGKGLRPNRLRRNQEALGFLGFVRVFLMIWDGFGESDLLSKPRRCKRRYQRLKLPHAFFFKHVLICI